MKNFSEILEDAKKSVVESNLTESQVRSLTSSKIKSVLGLTKEDADSIKPRSAQLIEKVAGFAKKKDGDSVYSGILLKLTAKEILWLKDNSDSLPERLNPIVIEE